MKPTRILKLPDGFELLSEGDPITKGCVETRDGSEWTICKHLGTWTSKSRYPTARPIYKEKTRVLNPKSLDYQSRIEAAQKAKPGDRWQHKMRPTPSEVTGNDGKRISLIHATGRKSSIPIPELAAQYLPVKP